MCIVIARIEALVSRANVCEVFLVLPIALYRLQREMKVASAEIALAQLVLQHHGGPQQDQLRCVFLITFYLVVPISC